MAGEKKTVGQEIGEILDAELSKVRAKVGQLMRQLDKLSGDAPATEEPEEKKAAPAKRGRPAKSSTKDDADEKEIASLLKELKVSMKDVSKAKGKDFARELVANYDGKQTLASLDLSQLRGLKADVDLALAPAPAPAAEEDGDDW